MKGDIVHIFNRGVDKRRIFNRERDYIRFLDNLIDFNQRGGFDESYFRRRQAYLSDIGCPTRGERLVNILYWCFMPNHVHIMLEENIDGGIGMFSRKVFGGYTKYFNEHNKRSGVLFQGPTQVVPILEDAQMLYLPIYIMLNPLKIFEPDYRDSGVKDVKKAIDFLGDYKWSSYYENIKGNVYNRQVTDKQAIERLFEVDQHGYQKEVKGWIEVNVGHPMSDKGVI